MGLLEQQNKENKTETKLCTRRTGFKEAL